MDYSEPVRMRSDEKLIPAISVKLTWSCYRNRFIADYYKGTIAFVDKYWLMIHRAAGWDALRYWLLVCIFLLFAERADLDQVS
jgi:hypothetical protein